MAFFYENISSGDTLHNVNCMKHDASLPSVDLSPESATRDIGDAILVEKDATLEKVPHFSCVTRETRKRKPDRLDIFRGDGYRLCCSPSTLTRKMRNSEFGKYRVSVTIYTLSSLSLCFLIWVQTLADPFLYFTFLLGCHDVPLDSVIFILNIVLQSFLFGAV